MLLILFFHICIIIVPSQIENLATSLTFYYVEDFRPEFLGHANTTISWDKPKGICIHYNDYYII